MRHKRSQCDRFLLGGAQLSLELDLLGLGDSASATTVVRVIIFPGLPSQECGVIVGFTLVWGYEDLGQFPVMRSDGGCLKVVSYAWGLCRLADGQLSLF